MPAVYFVKQDLLVQCSVEANLRELALQHDIDLYAFPANLVNCRGGALCVTCRIKVDNPRRIMAWSSHPTYEWLQKAPE